MSDIFAWTDSTIVLNWLVGNTKQFKTYIRNRVSSIVDKTPPDRWNHVSGTDNPADCASRGLLQLELPNHDLWWTGPPWLSLDSSLWPKQPSSRASALGGKGDLPGHHRTAGSTNHSLLQLFYILSSTICHCMDPAFCKQLPNSQCDYHKSQCHSL